MDCHSDSIYEKRRLAAKVERKKLRVAIEGALILTPV
jgi:hypothetical protein